jgi:hypothetical protein
MGMGFTPANDPGPLPFGPFTGFKGGAFAPLPMLDDPAKAGGSLVIFGI